MSGMAMVRALARLAPYDIAFIRHGNTGQAATDLARVLSEKGQQQCAKAATTYMTSFPAPLAPFALTSPAQRCMETATLALRTSVPTPELIEVPTLYDGMLQPGAADAFNHLGYASLQTYLAESEECRTMLTTHGEQVMSAINAVVAVRTALSNGAEAASDQRQTLCVFGHAVYLSSAALRLATLRQQPNEGTALIMQTAMNEASGVWVGTHETRALVV